jgi:hypothetical protein
MRIATAPLAELRAVIVPMPAAPTARTQRLQLPQRLDERELGASASSASRYRLSRMARIAADDSGCSPSWTDAAVITRIRAHLA